MAKRRRGRPRKKPRETELTKSIRALWEQEVPVDEIARRLDTTEGYVYRCRYREGWVPRVSRLDDGEWAVIEAKWRYGTDSVRGMAKEHGIMRSTIYRRAALHGWPPRHANG